MVRHTLSDPASRHRVLWASACWAIALVLLGFGIPFLVGGSHVTSVPTAYTAVTRYWPFGLHGYGAVMIGFGAVLAEALVQPIHRQPIPDRQVRVTLGTFVGFAAAIVVAFTTSWIESGTFTWQAIIYWASLALIAVACIAGHPDPARRDGVA